MNYLAKNLEYLLKKHNLSANQLQEQSGITQSTTTRIMKGETQNPRQKIVKEYADFFSLSVQDLMYTDLSANVSKIPNFKEIEDWDDDTPISDDEVPIVFYKDFRLACGHGTDSQAEEKETRRLRMSKITLKRRGIIANQAFAAVAEDDSMRPTIYDGDTIFVDTGRTTIKDGKIFAIEHGGLFRIKRLYKQPKGGVRIFSDNDIEFPEETLTAQDILEQEFKVIGWVFSIQRLETW